MKSSIVMASIIWLAASLAACAQSGNIVDNGADPTGTNDSTAAIAQAIATGLPVIVPKGLYLVTDASVLANGQPMRGEGKTRSLFRITSGFNMSALGVIRVGLESSVTDIGFIFDQPDTNRAGMTQYPPVIYAQGKRGFILKNLRFTAAWAGIDMRGDCGQARIENIDSGAISYGIKANGTHDFVHISGFHHWPFGFLAPTKLAAWQDGQTIAADLGTINSEAWSITNLNMFNGRLLLGGPGSIGRIDGLSLDGNYSRIEMNGGTFTISNLYKTANSSGVDDFAIKQAGGYLQISSFRIMGANGNDRLISVSGGGTVLQMGTGLFNGGPIDKEAFYVSNGANLMLSNVFFNYGKDTHRTAPFIGVAFGRLTMTGSRFQDKGTGSGNALEIAADEHHLVVGNAFLNWPILVPAGPFGVYKSNGGTSPTVNR